MTVIEVIYRDKGNEKLMTLEDMENTKDISSVKYHLYCAMEGCKCRMEYIPRGVKKAYFKKWRGDEYNHIEECIHFKATEIKKKSDKTVNTLMAPLNGKHKKAILRDMHKKYLETDEEKERRKQKDRDRKRNKPNQRVAKEEGIIEQTINKPTTKKDGNIGLDGERNPSVPRKYSVTHVNEDQLNATIALVGQVVGVEIHFADLDLKPSQVVIKLKDRLESRLFLLYLEEAFFAVSSANISTPLKKLKERVESGEDILLCTIGQVIKKDDQLGLAIYHEDDISINGKSMFW